ncbi:MAG: phosphonoacetaldehyde reductase [Clostridia bacterium]|nr:phosphonoacetaldehyde reductase [Clostridia bacterium]
MERALKKCNNLIFDVEDFEKLYFLVSPKKWMLVCDKSFDFLPTQIKKIYDMHKNNCVVFSDFESNPKYESVLAGLKLFDDNQCTLIVAIGGGSTIDVAKCIKLFYGIDGRELLFKQKPNYGLISKINLIALPTTAGTGSESTKHAVIYHNGVKQSICDNEIIPDAVILDSSVLRGLPIIHKKAALLDALCQACESWWSNDSNEQSVFYSELAILGIIDQWELYLSGDENAAYRILKAANYAGKAINITKTTAAHAMSYKLSSMYNIPHGIAVALCFPVVWEHMIMKADEKLLKVFDNISLCFHSCDSYSAISYFKHIIKEMEIVSPKSENMEEDIKILVDSVNPERLLNNPIKFDKNEIRYMYEEILK